MIQLETCEMNFIIRDAIYESFITQLCPKSVQDLCFSVQPSIVDENDLLLMGNDLCNDYGGLETFDQILIAIRKCWAKLFTFENVQYRRYYFYKFILTFLQICILLIFPITIRKE